MTKLDFHHCHFNNVFEPILGHCIVEFGQHQRPDKDNWQTKHKYSLQTRRIYHQVKLSGVQVNANTCIVAAILFSGHPYIGRHYFQVRHFNNVFDQSWCHCIVGATPATRSNCLQTRRIYHQVKYQRLNANTCIVAAILFSGHPYIGRHYRAP